MISILEQARDIHYFPRMNGYLFFGVRSARDVFFLGRLALLANSASGALKITICLSDGPVPDDLRERYPELLFAQGFVHEVALDQMIGRLGNVHAFLAGPPPAVDAAMRGLMLKGKLNPQSISFDKFS